MIRSGYYANILRAAEFEQAYSLSGMERHVVGYDLGIRECFADASNCSRLGRRAEAMDIHYLFARHEVGVLLDIGIFHNYFFCTQNNN